jgi:serine/threonine protein kinase
VDIFSVGVLMFIILTGKAPFQATSYKSLVMENFKCNIIYSSVTQLSQDAQQLLRALLSENPLKRPTALEALKFKWFTSSLKRVPLMRLQ